ncbi:MAG TPA: lysoplasmalogenase [Blastocatellia bacterium]|nr:lysoplasmalogenase [Blastocatellia bacterium]
MTAISIAASRRFDAIDRLLLGLSLACGATYLITRGLPAFPGSVVIKVLTVAPLALIAFRMLRDRDGLILANSLSFSTLGDMFLGIDGEKLFVFGLVSFLLAHLLYIVLFVRNRTKLVIASAGQKIIAALVMIFSAVMFAWLWPNLGDMRLPVAAYLCAITGMGVTATLAGFRAPWVVIGAMLFIVSDSMIAVGKFKSPIEYSDYLIWITYYVGQLFIALGFIREKNRSRFVNEEEA